MLWEVLGSGPSGGSRVQEKVAMFPFSHPSTEA